MSKTVIVSGSAREGDTKELVKELSHVSGWDVIDLNDYIISYYDYEHNNRHDDYLPLMQAIIDQYDTIVFATPVYWYAMSGILKVFFDRFSDLLTIEKSMGRRLRGKNMAAISCSVGNNLGEQFWLPFIETAKYLGMNYTGSLHTITGADRAASIADFATKISSSGPDNH